jgi:hypothetical protein
MKEGEFFHLPEWNNLRSPQSYLGETSKEAGVSALKAAKVAVRIWAVAMDVIPFLSHAGEAWWNSDFYSEESSSKTKLLI